MTFHVRMMRYIATAAAVIVCFGAAEKLAAQDSPAATAKNVFFTAAGTFATPAVSGNDLLLLAGEPFSLTIVANSALSPTEHGAHWAKYTGLKMSGAATTGIVGPPPLGINSLNASIELSTGNPSYDVFSLFCPTFVADIGQELYLTATIHLPKGTLTTSLIRPFTASVVLDSTITLTYSNHINSTVLAIQSGTLGTCVQGQTGCPPPSGAAQ